MDERTRKEKSDHSKTHLGRMFLNIYPKTYTRMYLNKGYANEFMEKASTWPVPGCCQIPRHSYFALDIPTLSVPQLADLRWRKTVLAIGCSTNIQNATLFLHSSEIQRHSLICNKKESVGWMLKQVILFSKLNKIFLGWFDPLYISIYSKSKQK